MSFTTLFFCLFGIIYIIDYYGNGIGSIKDPQVFKNHHRREEVKAIILIVFIGINSIFCVLNFKLLSFHIFLIKNKLTTYEYIMMMREKVKERLLNKKSTSKIKKSKIAPDITTQSTNGKRNKYYTQFIVDSQKGQKTGVSKIDKMFNKGMNDKKILPFDKLNLDSQNIDFEKQTLIEVRSFVILDNH